MSLKYEQCTALKRTRELLRALLDGSAPKTVKGRREAAYSCLKHFPHLNDHGLPKFSSDEFTDAEGKMR